MVVNNNNSFKTVYSMGAVLNCTAIFVSLVYTFCTSFEPSHTIHLSSQLTPGILCHDARFSFRIQNCRVLPHCCISLILI